MGYDFLKKLTTNQEITPDSQSAGRQPSQTILFSQNSIAVATTSKYVVNANNKTLFGDTQ